MVLSFSKAFVKGFISNSNLALTMEFNLTPTIVVWDFKVMVDSPNSIVQHPFGLG